MKRKYQERKNKIRNLINEFDLFDNLFKLAEAQNLINDLLKKNKFPTEEYIEWLKSND